MNEHDRPLIQLMHDPSTPFWARRVISEALDKDPIEAAQVLSLISELFSERADSIIDEQSDDHEVSK